MRPVVRGIRNPGEIRAFRERYQRFFLFGVYATRETRWERFRKDYDDNLKAFNQDDFNDGGEENEPYGQKVGNCFYESDVVLSNDRHISTIGNKDFNELKSMFETYVDLVKKPLSSRQPVRADETLMAMGYAASQRSSCLKRKVGALIVRDGVVLSSGFNEVPGEERPCSDEFGECHRERLSKDLLGELKNEVSLPADKEDNVGRLLKKRARMLDYCRALHAEESAILNLARSGGSVPLETCTMYTTTYPCRLCARKIVGVGLKQLVYFEPYPDPEAVAILRRVRGMRTEVSQGVTFRAYFRVYGEQR